MTTEVECRGRQSGKNVVINIQGTWNMGYNRPTIVTTGTSVKNYNLTYRAPWGGLNRVEYNGSAVRVQIDLYTEPRPRSFRIYYGTAFFLGTNSSKIELQCRYPYAPYN